MARHRRASTRPSAPAADPTTRRPDAADVLRGAAALFEERNTTYAAHYKRHGRALEAIFPAGLQLQTAADFSRYFCFELAVTKLMRYAAQFANGGHADSATDTAVYAAMLRELDLEEADRG